MIYFATLLSAILILDLIASLWLYVKVAQISENYYGLMIYTISTLSFAFTKIGLLIWVWML